MEKPGYVMFRSRKGWIGVTIILSCFLILYWVVKKNNYHMTATKSIKGSLYKAASGQPVEGAMVMVAAGPSEHQDIASQSDADGIFYLPELKVPGTYTLLINYGDQSKSVTVHVTGDSLLKIPW